MLLQPRFFVIAFPTSGKTFSGTIIVPWFDGFGMQVLEIKNNVCILKSWNRKFNKKTNYFTKRSFLLSGLSAFFSCFIWSLILLVDYFTVGNLVQFRISICSNTVEKMKFSENLREKNSVFFIFWCHNTEF